MTTTDPDSERGLYGKYVVHKRDTVTGELRDPGPVFVLAYATDPHARVALAAYAESCDREFHPLAEDLRDELEYHRQPDPT